MVLAVGFYIEQVVDDVRRRGAEAEAEEGKNRLKDQGHFQGVSQQQRHEDKHILGPLVQADGLEECFASRCAVFEVLVDFNFARLDQRF